MSDEIKATEAEVPQEQAAAVEAKEPSLPADYKPLSTALRFFYGVGDFGFNIMNSVENYYFVFFLTNCAMLDPVLAGIVSTVGSVIDAIVGWLWGAIINTIKPMRWGRYRSFLFIMPWAVPILFALDYVKFSDNPVVTAVLITIFYVASHCTWDFPYVANVSMIAVVGQTPEDRAHLASTRGMWSNASKILFAYIFPPVAMVGAMLLGNQNTDPSAAPANYAFAAFVFGCVMAALYNVHFFITKGYEKEYTKEELANWKAAKKEDKTNNSAGDLGRSIASNPNVIFLMLGDVAKWIFNFVVGGTAVYYFTYVAFNPGMLATYIFATNVGTVVGAYLGGPVSKALKGSKKAVIAAFIVMIAMLLISRVSYTQMMVVVVCMTIAQAGYGLIYAVIPAMYGDCVVYSEWKTGKNSAGWISGLQVLPLKIGFFARGVVIPAILGAAGFVAGMTADQSTPALQEGIVNGWFVLPAILCVISMLILIFGYRINNDVLAQAQKEIAERQDNE